MSRSLSSTLSETALHPGRLETLRKRLETADDRPSIAVRTPITDEPIGEVPACTTGDVEAAVSRAREAHSRWDGRAVEDRAAVIDRFGDLVSENREELLDLIQLETGKARRHAVEEIVDVPLACSYCASRGPSALREEGRTGAIPPVTDARVVYDPLGVVGVISPWNYPVTLTVADAVPALLAGNAVVCKPDERTPYTALALAELLEEAGLPEGVFEVVTGEGPVVGPALIDRVDYVAFTGGTETGRTVAERAGRNLIDCSLELGGKNPAIVLADADLEATARGIVQGAFTNAGQLCLAPERVYVDDARYAAFLDAFVAETRGLTLGLEFDYDPDVGSLIDDEHLESVAGSVEEAVEDGASVLTGGRERPDVGPFCYEPTILADVDPDSRVACEETFGPVVSVISVADTGEAVEAANDSRYGLNASVWTADRERGLEVAREVECGTVCVNDAYTVGWAAVDSPMGGVGESGLGRRHGPEGIRRFTDARTIATSKVGPLADPPGIPTAWYVRGMVELARLQRRLQRWFR